jgi:hypothetical protein
VRTLCDGGLVLALVALTASGCGRGAPPAANQPPPLAAQSVYRDPATGKLGAPPPGAAPATPPAARVSTSAAGLAEKAGPRGGWMVHLQGRYQSQVRGARTASGLSTECAVPEDRQ